MMRTMQASLAVVLCAAIAMAFAQPPAATQPTIAKETRDKLAALHEQMATCLRSEKSVAECHSEVLKSCKEQLGTDNCPLMGVGPGGGDHRMHPMGATPK